MSIALLAFALVVLTLSPVLVSMWTRDLRYQITEVAEPAIAAASGIERNVGLQLAALRGYALTGSDTYLKEYARLHDVENEHSSRLRDLAGNLDPEIAWQTRRVVSLAAEWDESVSAAIGGDGSGPEAVDRLVTRESVATTLLAEARSLRRSVESIERVRRTDIAWAERIEVWVNWVMVLVAAGAGGFLVVAGRRVHELAVDAEEQRAKLQRSVDRRARLMRGISHDLKNPLGAARAHADLLRTEIPGTLNSKQKTSVEAIERSTDTTIRLVEDLVHLARAERGELAVRPTDVDFSRLAADVAGEAEPDAEAKDLALEADAAPTVRGRTDPERVREVLQNLLSNAIHYTPPGGRVTLRVEEEGSSTVRISVADTGPGIAPADRERIFDEFERGGHGSDGSGLGLTISRHIAHMLGGEIEVSSEVGEGSRFSLVLPIDLEEAEES